MSELDTPDTGPATATAPPEDALPAAPAFDVRISRDQVTVMLDCPDPMADLAATAALIVGKFEELKLPEYPDQAMVQEMLQAIATPGAYLQDQPLIMGEHPVPPQDGRLEWARDFFATGWAEDAETGAVNHWEKLERRSVAADEVIARIQPPVPGTPGLNVFGKAIGVAKPQIARLRAGKGVTEVDRGGVREFRAAFAGRVRLVSGVVSVDDVYAIRGDVSLETGNIHHTGCVTIGGDVKAGALIEADGDIIVKGMLEPCTVRGGGALTVAGGIVGDVGCSIAVAGELQARYVSEATIRAGGDVKVSGEIAHSDIETLGRVLVPEGRIAGGTTTAWKGIRVGEAGASGSARTILIAGSDPTLAERVGEVRERARKALAARQRVGESIRVAGSAGPRMTEAQRAAVAALKVKLDTLTLVHAEATRTVDDMIAAADEGGVPEIVMYKEVWSGTTILLGEQKLVVRASVLKPRLARLGQTGPVLLPLGEGNMPVD